MELTFWGVRGSIPTAGPHTARWGGNSSCVEIRSGALPPMLFDCGTGARPAGADLVRRPGRAIHVWFSHFHMDHLFGFPFFLPIYTPGYQVTVHVPAYTNDQARSKLARYLDGTLHPVRLADLPSAVAIEATRARRRTEVDGWTVDSVSLQHPGGSIGYRVNDGRHSAAYVTDTGPFARPDEGLSVGLPATRAEARIVEFLRGCDMVVYDTMFERNEYLDKMTWGHSYPEYAMALCREAGVGTLVLFHHHPDATDDDIDALAARYAGQQGPRIVVAREGATLAVGEGAMVAEG